jgi:hypothetical protein
MFCHVIPLEQPAAAGDCFMLPPASLAQFKGFQKNEADRILDPPRLEIVFSLKLFSCYRIRTGR